MGDSGETRDDIRLPDSDVGKDIQQRSSSMDNTVTILKACGEEMVIAVKNKK